ncbi:hypothetical protein [Asticcacaulis sp. AND118]|uniref:hypothetical protein n=1 Tax=Asticcacaulis sp. AND118 TaxID=2840468 RepID=UPI001CFFA651|nr:hypothetical protein [Asticcacaulis sp. AND118]UDF03072.1 hypothetical protein LH365_11610 [Asticcacaulis sp. AND118]
MRLPSLLAAVALCALTATAASAQNSPVAVDVHGGTTGIGIGARFKLNDTFVLRADYDALKHDDDFNSDDVNYNGELDFKPFTFAVDVHPFRNSFFVSAGYATGDRNIKLDARPAGNTEIGGVTFTPTEIGTLRANADMGDGAPFVGLGFDNTFTKGGRVGFRFLAGAIIGDDPSVNMTSDGTLANQQIYKDALERERLELQEDVKDVKTWPVLQLGVNIRF